MVSETCINRHINGTGCPGADASTTIACRTRTGCLLVRVICRSLRWAGLEQLACRQ
jgi:hypothetical protein